MDNRKEQIDMLAKSMIAEGLLDQQFNELLLLEGDGGGFLAEVIKLFCVDCERIVNELSNLLDQPVVEYEKVGSIAHQLKGSSSSIGANSIHMACLYLRGMCNRQDRQGCVRALSEVRNEYCRLQPKFNVMMQFL